MRTVHARHVRTLGAYEPRPGTPAARGSTGQLAFAAHRPTVLVPQPRPSDLPTAPTESELRGVIAALVEVVGGRRAVGSLRRRLSADLQRRLRETPGEPLGLRFVVRPVHVNAAGPGTLEVCATVHVPHTGTAFAVAGRLQAFWHGWTFTDFDVVLPTARAERSAAAA